MQNYYARLEGLRERLVATGHGHWAIELLNAERAASTSGEALSNTGVVLKRLLDSTDSYVSDFRNEAQSIYDEGGAIWDGMNK